MNLFEMENFMDFFEDYTGELSVIHKHSDRYDVSFAHIHPHGEMLLKVSDGNMTFIVNGKEVSVNGPCIAYYPPYIMHKTRADDEYERLVLYIGEEPNFTIPSDRQSLITEKDGWAWILKIDEGFASECTDYFYKISADNKDRDEALLWYGILLKNIERYIREKYGRIDCAATNGALTVLNNSDYHIQKIIRYIISHYNEPITTDNITREFHINRDKLNKEFKRFTNTSIRQFIIEIRLNRAKAFLCHGMQISDAAEKTGFQSTSYFITSFTKRYGISPSKYSKLPHIDEHIN